MGKTYGKKSETVFISDDVIDDDDLFADDESYKIQVVDATTQHLREDAKKFMKVSLLHSCQDCQWRDGDGNCHVMEHYNKAVIFPVTMLEKCSHWKIKTDY